MRKVFLFIIQVLIINGVLITTIACNSLTERGGNGANGADELDLTGYRYDNLPDPNEASGAMAEFRALSRFDKLDLSYYFINGTEKLPGDEEHELVREAFAIWAAETPLTFTETNNRAASDIEIAWARRDHGDGDPFDGPGQVLAHATFPNPFTSRRVILHFDDDERWVNSSRQNVDLLTVAIHEIGHTLGLGHSDDPNAIMFASYRGPRRTLGEDDIDGIQRLYGIAEEVPPMPDAPPPDNTPPPSPQQDSDGDGISDVEEAFMTGTDPNNPDSDGDGLSDGFEVQNRLNPLNPDTDQDGASDGQEVQQGTDPFMPDQDEIMSSLSPETVQEIRVGLRNAINRQILAFRRGDASLTVNALGGQLLNLVQAQINDLNSKGLVQIMEFDFLDSYVADARVINNNQVELDMCPIWGSAIFRRSDGALVQNNGSVLQPQTVLMERIGDGLIPTTVQFHDAPAFCQR